MNDPRPVMNSAFRVNEANDACCDCGAVIAGGQDGCQALWDQYSVHGYSDIRFGGLRDLAFDAYCMQHHVKYCISAKLYAAHLTRLCCGLEHGGDAQVYAAIRRWLDGTVPLARPVLPVPGWTLTLVDVASAVVPDE
jgi:hypothetical protein